MELDILPDPIPIGHGYLITPLSQQTVEMHFSFNEIYGDHAYKWPEYAIWDMDSIYPRELKILAEKGLAFLWEYICTEDFSYFAYNFPTEDKPNNLTFFKTGKRKCAPKLSKKLRLQIEKTSAANELLYHLGIDNGTIKP